MQTKPRTFLQYVCLALLSSHLVGCSISAPSAHTSYTRVGIVTFKMIHI